MSLNREEAVKRLLESYRAYYNITEYPAGEGPLRALCEYYEHDERYVITRKANLWTAEGEEFIYLYELPVLDLESFKKLRDTAYEEGMKLAHIQKGHMYTYITPVFICDHCEPEAIKALRKYSRHKTFLFSFHGWMDMHLAAYDASAGKIYTNSSGKCAEKSLKKILCDSSDA